MHAISGLISQDHGHCHILHGTEEIDANHGIPLLEESDQALHFCPLTALLGTTAACAGFGQTAGTVDEVQVIVISPVDDVLFTDVIHGTDQFHAREIGGLQLGHHGLDLSGIEHAHQGRLDDIIEVMKEIRAEHGKFEDQ